MLKKDWVRRIKKKSGGESEWRLIERRICEECKVTHRILPDDQVPYKHYGSELIEKVIDDNLSEDEVLENEDYPCDDTKARWREWGIYLMNNAEGQIRSAVYRILDYGAEFLFMRDSLLERIKGRIRRGWLSVALKIMVNTGGLGVIPRSP
ncbi:MAG: DUF6431 domain-containing protein [Eubacterium sp.]|nr:DUF6431 domain-containing protein [Eubacterium sp.]